MATKKKAKRGRPSLYSEPMAGKIAVRLLNAEQVEAISLYCQRHRISAIALMREASLEVAGLSEYGIGIAAASGREDFRGFRDGSERVSLPVPYTRPQLRALRGFLEKRGLEGGPFIREATLQRVGAAKLGAVADADRLARAVGAR